MPNRKGTKIIQHSTLIIPAALTLSAIMTGSDFATGKLSEAFIPLRADVS